VLDETRHIYYTSSWQAIEERLGTDPDSSDASQQYVWGIRYIDDLVLRDRDTSEPSDGTLNEQLYAIQDPNWNVTTIIDDSGDVQERYEYEAYGNTIRLDAEYSSLNSHLLEWIRLYRGYEQDRLSGLYQVRYRVLCPQLGTWMQRDPAIYIDGYNLYASYAALYAGLHPFGLAVIVVLTHHKANEKLSQFDPDDPSKVIARPLAKDAFEEIATMWNSVLANQKALATKYGDRPKYSINGRKYSDAASFKKGLDILYMKIRVVDQGKGKKHVFELLHQAAKDAGPDGEVFFETHTMNASSLFGIKDEKSIQFGSEGDQHKGYVAISGVGAELGQFKAKLGFGSCFLGKEEVEKLAADLNTSISGTTQVKHPILNIDTRKNEDGENEISFNWQTPFEAQENKANPPKKGK